jgi:hypothetical protein
MKKEDIINLPYVTGEKHHSESVFNKNKIYQTVYDGVFLVDGLLLGTGTKVGGVCEFIFKAKYTNSIAISIEMLEDVEFIDEFIKDLINNSN